MDIACRRIGGCGRGLSTGGGGVDGACRRGLMVRTEPVDGVEGVDGSCRRVDVVRTRD